MSYRPFDRYCVCEFIAPGEHLRCCLIPAFKDEFYQRFRHAPRPARTLHHFSVNGIVIRSQIKIDKLSHLGQTPFGMCCFESFTLGLGHATFPTFNIQCRSLSRLTQQLPSNFRLIFTNCFDDTAAISRRAVLRKRKLSFVNDSFTPHARFGSFLVVVDDRPDPLSNHPLAGFEEVFQNGDRPAKFPFPFWNHENRTQFQL